jgi:serine/threonine protein kinase/Tfp pilus assembly protein PilF
MADSGNNNQDCVIEKALKKFVDEYLRGQQPDEEEFVGQYPDCEDLLRQRIQNLLKINTLFDTLVQMDKSDFDAAETGLDRVGQKIEGFEIEQIIGQGGMGVVYLARDTKLDRSVALKSMPAELWASSTAQARFKREAKLLASLNHPNIALIYEIIEQQEGAGYLVLEYVPGQSLAQRIAREPLKLEETLSVARQIAEAVSAAHEKGVVHRDLKPGNIKITPEGKVKVLDFGLAKTSVGEGRSDEITVTQPGRIMGTPAYMSPEQACGKPTDKRSDIWSFGCIMYQMLTGELPFDGETATDTLARIIERQPDWQRLPQEIPMNIRTLLRRCLEKKAQQRLQHIGDAVIEISETLNIPVTAPPVTTPSSTSLKPKITTRHNLRTAATIIIAAFVIVLSVIVVQRVSKKEVSPSLKEIRLVVLPFENLGSDEDEYFADGITDAITARLAGIHGLAIISRQSAIQYKKSEKNLQQIGKELSVDYILEGTVQCEQPSDPNSRVRIIPQLINASEDTHMWTEIYDDNMSEVFRLQSDVAEKVAKALDISLLEPERMGLKTIPTTNTEADDYYLQGIEYHRQGNREDTSRIAIQMYEKAVELDPKFALAYARLAGMHSLMYWLGYDRSEENHQKEKQAIDKALELNPKLPEAHIALGSYHYHRYYDYDRALEQYAIARKLQPSNTNVLSATALVQRRQGKFEQAAANLKRLYDLSPRGRILLIELAYTHEFLRNYPEAEPYRKQAISWYPDWYRSYKGMALLYMRWQGDTKKARAVLEKALENGLTENDFIDSLFRLDLYERNYQAALGRLSSKPKDIRNKWKFISNSLQYAGIYGYMGKKELAEKCYDEARSVLESQIEKQPENVQYHSWLGVAYAGLGRKEDAIREGKLAVEMQPVSKEAIKGTQWVEELARIDVMVGEYDAAIDQLEYLLSIPGPLSIPLLRLDPTWDPLRNHPRFKKLIDSDK